MQPKRIFNRFAFNWFALETEPGNGINFVGTYSYRSEKENVGFKKLLKLVRTLCLWLSSMQHFRAARSLANKGIKLKFKLLSFLSVKGLLWVNCTCCVMLTFTVDFSVNRHQLIIYVVILLRANFLVNWFMPWRTLFKLSCPKNFPFMW